MYREIRITILPIIITYLVEVWYGWADGGGVVKHEAVRNKVMYNIYSSAMKEDYIEKLSLIWCLPWDAMDADLLDNENPW